MAAFDIPSAVNTLGNLADDIINKIWPNPEDKAKAEVMLATAELDNLKTKMSVMLAEASSDDPWTSRARPSFLYVVYILILFAIPMGIVSAVSPEIAKNIATGFGAWLTAIPKSFTDLFETVMTGYILARSYDKNPIFTKK